MITSRLREKVGHYFKRMTMIELMFGDTATHLTALAEMGGLIAAA